MQIQIRKLIDHITQRLQLHYQDPSRAHTHAWWLLIQVTKSSMTDLLRLEYIEMNNDYQQWLENAIDEIACHKPIQYILQSIPFAQLHLRVREPVLIPRPETEAWVVQLCETLKPFAGKNLHILDIGTGTGCIALSLAQSLHNAQIYAIDISTEALELAQENAKTNHIENIRFIQSDLFDQIHPSLQFDIIVSNPPYISPQAWVDLEPHVKDWEDYRALVADHEGYDTIHQIIQKAPQYLRLDPDLKSADIPQLILEIGYDQSVRVQDMLKKYEYYDITTTTDLAGHTRTVRARYCP